MALRSSDGAEIKIVIRDGLSRFWMNTLPVCRAAACPVWQEFAGAASCAAVRGGIGGSLPAVGASRAESAVQVCAIRGLGARSVRERPAAHAACRTGHGSPSVRSVLALGGDWRHGRGLPFEVQGNHEGLAGLEPAAGLPTEAAAAAVVVNSSAGAGLASSCSRVSSWQVRLAVVSCTACSTTGAGHLAVPGAVSMSNSPASAVLSFPSVALSIPLQRAKATVGPDESITAWLTEPYDAPELCGSSAPPPLNQPCPAECGPGPLPASR
jgi:hypothetical protein